MYASRFILNIFIRQGAAYNWVAVDRKKLNDFVKVNK